MGTSKGDPRGDPSVYGYPQQRGGSRLYGPLGALLLGLQQRRDRSSFVEEREQFITQGADRFQSIGTPEAIQMSELFRSAPKATWQTIESLGGMGKVEDGLRERASQAREAEANAARKGAFAQIYERRARDEIGDEEIVPLMMQVDPSLKYSEALDIRDKMDELRPREFEATRLEKLHDYLERALEEGDTERAASIRKVIAELERDKTGGMGFSITGYDEKGRPLMHYGTGEMPGHADLEERATGESKVERLGSLLGTLRRTSENLVGTRGTFTDWSSRLAGVVFGTKAQAGVLKFASGDTMTPAEQTALLVDLKSTAYSFRKELAGEAGARLTEPERDELKRGVGAKGLATIENVEGGLRALGIMSVLSDERTRAWTGARREFPASTGAEAAASQQKLMGLGYDAATAEEIVDRLYNSFHLFDADDEARYRAALERAGRAPSAR